MDALQDAFFWIVVAAFVAGVAWQLFHVSRSDEVGRVQASGEPFGWRGEGATIAVRRRRGFRRHPRIVLMLHQDGLRVLTLSAPEARKLAALLEEAATGAHTRATAAIVGTFRGITIGLPRQADGVGWVSWMDRDRAQPAAALAAPSARKLAELLRMAAQPGHDLDAAREAWRRAQQRAGARGAP